VLKTGVYSFLRGKKEEITAIEKSWKEEKLIPLTGAFC
jgi:hypothetical protein